MPKTKKSSNGNGDMDINDGETWKKHNLYDVGCSANRIVTRSQTPFVRIKNTSSDLNLFSNAAYHHPDGLPHLMVTMKGKYGAIPNTVITRSTGKQLELSRELCDKLDEYKKKAGIYTGSSGGWKKGDDDDASSSRRGSKSKKFDEDEGSYRKEGPEKRRKTGEKFVFDKNETWRNHDLYDVGCSANRIVTRSQTAFARLRNTSSDLELFANKSSYNPPGLPHLMVTMKGEYGAIPKTVITRSTGKHLEISKDLCNKVDEYKKKAGISKGSSNGWKKGDDDDTTSSRKGSKSKKFDDDKDESSTSYQKKEPEKRRKTGEKFVFNKNETWKNHDLYDVGCSVNRIVTRSQTGFARLNNTVSDLELFADKSSYNPPGLPHLMVTMKGEYGAIPKTVITRSTGKHLEVSKDLCSKVDEYKKKNKKNSKDS